MASHQIRVFVHVPKTLDNPLSLQPENWTWIHLLTFPVSFLNDHRYSTRPYKWMRFVTGIII